MAKLAPYRAKRDFTRTSEPRGKAAPRGAGFSFVVQKHDASRLHYDLRLELDGVYRSWAVAKGPSLVPGEKRLAVHVEDHPLDYGAFEGTIPAGEYGGGTVLLWDRGRWEPEGDPRKGYAKGHLTFALHGEKLHGSWHLVRMRRRPKEKQESWLLIKSEDDAARGPGDPDILEEAPLSVKTGRDLAAVAAGARPQRKSAAKSARPASARPASPAPKARTKRATAERRRADPMPTEIAPCLATLVETAPEGPRWIHEIKWDGYRLIAFLDRGRARLKTRNGLDWTDRFPGIAEAVSALPLDTAILDGEAVMEDASGVASFAALQEALSLKGRKAATGAVFYAFDLLYADGEDWRGKPLLARKEALEGVVGAANDPRLRFSEHMAADGAAMVRSACRLGLEGVVSKRTDKPYRSGRRDDWVKTKCTERQEFVVAGYVPSTTARNAIGSLVLGIHEGDRLVYRGRTGTGFSSEVAVALKRRLAAMKTREPPFAAPLAADQRRGVVFVRPDLVAEVEYRGLTGEGLVRHAAFKGLREDKGARDVVQETKRPPQGAAGARPRRAAGDALAGVRLTHPDRVLFEDQGLTKQGLAEYYVEIAPWILPHIADRPLALVRCPSGAGKGCFFQKHSWAGLDGHIAREMVRDESGEEEVLHVRDVAGLVALVQAGVLEIHPWGARLDDIERPDRIVFDFDPGEDVAWVQVLDAARDLRDRLLDKGLRGFPKTTGGKGLHVVVPLTPRAGWDEVKSFARDMAEAMERDAPDRFLTKATKAARAGRIFIDYLRNGRGATAVAPYSPRARPGAPVATPLAWEELSPALKANHFTVANLPTRLRSLGRDPWAEMARVAQTLPAAAKRRR